MQNRLIETLQEHAAPALRAFLSHQGEPAEAGAKAAALSVPLTIAALLKSIAGNPQNAEALSRLLDSKETAGLLDGIGQAVSAGTLSEAAAGFAKKLLPELFGGNAADAADALAAESGIAKVAAANLAAPSLLMVLDGLRHNTAAGLTPLLTALSGTGQSLETALPKSLLAALGIAGISGLTHHAASMAANVSGAPAGASLSGSRQSSAGTWITLILAAILAAFAFKSCQKTAPEAAPPAASAASATSAAAVPASAALETASAAMTGANLPASDTAAQASAAGASAASSAAVAAEARTETADGAVVFYFASGKADIAAGSETAAAAAVDAGKAGKKLTVSGFTDSTGNAAANAELSKKRALAVKAFLEAQGVPADRIELMKPADTEGAQGNDAAGRRVEVRIAE